MALINIDQGLNDTLRILKKSETDGGVELLSYKRNRSIALIINHDGFVTIRENGYVVEESVVPLDSLAKRLKTIMKREFPRSRKIRLFKFESPEQLDRVRQKI